MPDGQKVVQVPGVGNIAFPATMADADINTAITNHLNSQKSGAFQQRPGGPVINAKNLATDADVDNGPSFTGLLRDTALEAGKTMVPNAGTSATQNLKNIGTGLNEQVNTAATTPWGQGGPIWGVLTMLAKGLMSGVHGAASGVEKMGSGVASLDPQKVAEGGGSTLGNLFQAGALKEGSGAELVNRDALKNLSNLGPEKASFIERQVGKGNAVQQHVKSALDAVYEDGKQQMGTVSQTIDAAEPNGAFNRGDVHAAVKDAMGVVKAEQKVPAAITKVLDTFAPDDTGGWVQKGGKLVQRSTGPRVGGGFLDLNTAQGLKTYKALKAQGAFSPEEVARMEGGNTEGKMPFEELKQVHSDIGKQIANTDGPVEAGVKTAYAKLGEMLRNKAESHGMLNEWQQGTQKIKGYYDAVYRSPLKSTYFGQNHGEIMKPFVSDDTSPQVNQILQKYTPYGIDLDKLQETAGAYKYGEQWDKMSNPSKRMAIVAAISPKTAAGMMGAPRAMRSNVATKYTFPNQLNEVPNVSPSKIYPSSKAAAKAATKGNPIPPGNKTPFGGGGINTRGVEESTKPMSGERTQQSLSSEIDTMKSKLRDAGSAPENEKAALKRQIKDYQQRLDELRGTS